MTATDISAPQPIAAVFGASDRDAWIAEQEHKRRCEPEGYFPLGYCRHCQKSLGDQSDPETKVMPIGVFGFLPNVCCSSCSAMASEKWRQDEVAAQEARFTGQIPPAFALWDETLGNNAARQRALAAFSFDSGKGLILHGHSGSCKTRIVWQLARLIVEQNAKSDAGREITWAVFSSYELATKGIPAEAFKVRFLFVDDLGNEPTSTKFETGFLHLIRERCDWHRPCIITTQLNGSDFKKRFFGGAAGEAILRRLGERTNKVSTDAI